MSPVFAWMAHVNKQNMQWASEHLHNVMETLLYQKYAWCDLSTSGVDGPVFFCDNTVTVDCYLYVL
jgi:hypothetical protein